MQTHNIRQIFEIWHILRTGKHARSQQRQSYLLSTHVCLQCRSTLKTVGISPGLAADLVEYKLMPLPLIATILQTFALEKFHQILNEPIQNAQNSNTLESREDDPNAQEVFLQLSRDPQYF
jgi:hypothetical protein